MKPIVPLGASRWVLLATQPHQSSRSLVLAARLAEEAPLLILDGGNRANVHVIAKQAGWQVKVLARIRISRAFTCYQMAALLESIQAETVSILILDLLSTFYDENIPLFDRERLLKACLRRMGQLSRVRRLFVTVSPPPGGAAGSAGLYEFMLASAPQVYRAELPAAVESQPRLF
jgi:hypothetical protein